MRRDDLAGADEGIRVQSTWASCGFHAHRPHAACGAGGKLTVDGAVTIAEALGVSQALIGFTIVAVERHFQNWLPPWWPLARGRADIAVGNIVGSNIFNIFWILGVSSAIAPLPFQPAMNVDLLVTVAATVLLFFAMHTGFVHKRIFFWKQKERHVIERSDGVLMLLGYAAYLTYLAWRG